MASIKSDIEEKGDVRNMENVSPHSFENKVTEEIENKVNGDGGNAMIILKEKLFDIKMIFESQWLRYGCAGNFESTRIYQIWPGKNVFFFHGRLLCGPDPRGLLLTTVSIILSSWIFDVYIGQDLPKHTTTFSLILTLIVLVNLVLVSAIDPGIIPRNEQEQVENTTLGNRNKRATLINGVELQQKYCRICKIYRPPRSCHCVVCDNCVEKFDHHCPWIGQCIALRNYRFYLTFLVSTLAFFIYVFAFCCWRLHQTLLKSESGLLVLLRNCPETLALATFSFAAILFLAGLVLFHLYLTAINQTAYENFRERYVDSRNPYDKGIVSNFKEVLLVKLPPSRVDFRAEVEPIWYPLATSIEV